MLNFNLVTEKTIQLGWVTFDLMLLDMLVQPQAVEVAVFLALKKEFWEKISFVLNYKEGF